MKSASAAAVESAKKGANRAQDELSRRGIGPEGIGQAAKDSARELGARGVAEARRARERAEASGVDVSAFTSATFEGLDVTNRHGEIKRWRIAKAALRPVRSSRGVATSFARETLRQRRELLAAGRALASPGLKEFETLDLDEPFYNEALDWIVAESGATDSDRLRVEIYIYLAEHVIDEVAESALTPEALATYRSSVDGDIVDLPGRTAALLAHNAAAKEPVLQRLEATRSSAADLFGPLR